MTSTRQDGGVLVEFAISIGVLWLIVAAALDLGRAFASAHVLQSAARSTARELALEELRYDASFEDALARVFDPDYLVVDADCLEEEARRNDTTPEAALATILGNEGLRLNQALRPLMVFERVNVGGRQWHLLRYPGALLRAEVSSKKLCAEHGFAVAVPEVDDNQSRVVLQPVVGEIEPGAFNFNDPNAGGALAPGTVGLRLLYPFQAAGLTSWRLVDDTYRTVPAAGASDFDVEFDPSVNASTMGQLDDPDAYVLNSRGDAIPVYGGSLGLGIQGVLGRTVRPFRRVLSAQAISARESLGAGL